MPEFHSHNEASVPCQEFEDLILDYFDGGLSSPQNAKVEAHIKDCVCCREFWKQQQELDSLLTQSIRPPSPLPPDFRNQMLQWAQADSRNTAKLQRLEAEPEEEYLTTLAGLKKFFVRRSLFAMLDGAGVISMTVAVGVAWKLLAAHPTVAARLQSDQFSNYAIWGVAGACLLGGIWYASNSVKESLGWD